MRNCDKCTKDVLCDGYDKFVNQKKEFSVKLNELKRQTPKEIVHLLPKYKTI